MTGQVDIAVIGAGPAGMSAAIAARAQGRSVTVLDEQPAAGGQIYRGVLSMPQAHARILGPDYTAGAELARAFAACGAQHVQGAAVWQVTPQRRISFLQAGTPRELDAGAIVLCTGAMERAFPVPGWTLPGVMTAGAAQILLKSADVLPAGAVVLAGCGPLLVLLAAQYLRAGVRITAVVDTTGSADYRGAVTHLPAALRDWPLLVKGWRLLRELRRSGTPVHAGATGISIEGETAARAIHFRSAGRDQRIEAGLFLLHQGIVPNTQVTRSLRASHVWDDEQLCWRPELGAGGELAGLPGIYVAGDGARIMGAVASATSGRMAGLAAAQAPFDAEARRVAAAVHARPFLDALYRPKQESRVPADAVIVCRCEEVTAGEIRKHVRGGCVGPNQLKAFTRCGMGPCQGRQCGLTVAEIIAAERGLPPADVGYQRVRPPIKPITLGELAGS